LTLTVALLALVACGDGSGLTTNTAAQSVAELHGAILEVDGQTIDRNGIDVLIVESGDYVQTGQNGSFEFPDLAPGWYTLDFNPRIPRALTTEEGGL
jgi:hypothetical protein